MQVQEHHLQKWAPGSWLIARMADLTLDPETPLAGLCCLSALPTVDFVDTAMVFVTVVFVESPVLAVCVPQ